MKAAEMFEGGVLSQAETARRVGVAHQTVSDWHDAWEVGGREALRAAGRAGRLPKAQRRIVRFNACFIAAPRRIGHAGSMLFSTSSLVAM